MNLKLSSVPGSSSFMGHHWSSRCWIFATTKRTLCVSELLQSLSVPTSLGKKMTRPELLSHALHNLHVRDLTGDETGVHLFAVGVTV